MKQKLFIIFTYQLHGINQWRQIQSINMEEYMNMDRQFNSVLTI